MVRIIFGPRGGSYGLFAPMSVLIASGAEEALNQVRILLVGMSNMLANIVAAGLVHAPDIVVAGRRNELDDIDAEVRSARADAVVTQVLHPEDGVLFRPLLCSFPTLKVIAIADDGSSGFVHELQLVSTRLAELSSNTLQDALRGELSC